MHLLVVFFSMLFRPKGVGDAKQKASLGSPHLSSLFTIFRSLVRHSYECPGLHKVIEISSRWWHVWLVSSIPLAWLYPLLDEKLPEAKGLWMLYCMTHRAQRAPSTLGKQTVMLTESKLQCLSHSPPFISWHRYFIISHHHGKMGDNCTVWYFEREKNHSRIAFIIVQLSYFIISYCCQYLTVPSL